MAVALMVPVWVNSTHLCFACCNDIRQKPELAPVSFLYRYAVDLGFLYRYAVDLGAAV